MGIHVFHLPESFAFTPFLISGAHLFTYKSIRGALYITVTWHCYRNVSVIMSSESRMVSAVRLQNRKIRAAHPIFPSIKTGNWHLTIANDAGSCETCRGLSLASNFGSDGHQPSASRTRRGGDH